MEEANQAKEAIKNAQDAAAKKAAEEAERAAREKVKRKDLYHLSGFL